MIGDAYTISGTTFAGIIAEFNCREGIVHHPKAIVRSFSNKMSFQIARRRRRKVVLFPNHFSFDSVSTV
jgi:hypothetical protein